MANLVMDGVTIASKSGSTVTVQGTNVNIDAPLANASFPDGHVLQVKIASRAYGDGISHGSTTYIDINSITITPVATNSKFFLIGSFSIYRNSSATTATGTGFARNVNGGSFVEMGRRGTGNGYNIYNQDSFNGVRTHFVTRTVLDDPTYTAGQALIYKTQQNSSESTSQTLGRDTELVVMEISGS